MYSNALSGMRSVGGDGRDESVQLIFLLLQLLHKALDRSLREGLALSALSVTHQTVHDAKAGIVARRGVRDGHSSDLSSVSD